jgi:phenylpyruvate tautomerase PptA (4-oxalocrotonate tautomerase family)
MLGALPVVRIRALPQRDVDTALVLTRVTHELAHLLGEEPEGTWATWETIAPGQYAEGGVLPSEQPTGTHPPLVSVIAFAGRGPDLIERIVVRVADVLARELALEPGNVFVTYEEARPGRLYTGGAVARGH